MKRLLLTLSLIAGILTQACGQATVRYNNTTKAVISPIPFRVGQSAVDPTTPGNGSIWYDTANNTLDARINGATVNLGAGGSSITGADTRVLFFDGANTPAGDLGLTYNKTTDTLTVAGTIVVSSFSGDATFDGDVTGSTGKFLDLLLGTASTTDGTLVLRRAANAFTTTIKTGVTGASYTLTLPTTDGAANEFLQTNGSGVLTWAAGAGGGGLTVGATAITGGAGGSVLYETGGNMLGELLTVGSGNVSLIAGTLNVSAGKSFTVENTMTFDGGDGSVMTFPTSSATIARTDAAQTFTGTQAFGALSATTPTLLAADTIWDAAGDLAIGTGANTAARLAKGTALQLLRVNAGGTALEWAAASGGAFDPASPGPLGGTAPGTGAFTTLDINTNGTAVLLSSYKGADSNGDNIFIGGGGQSSVGEGGATYKGSSNTANGRQALFSNTTGYFNTANGTSALYSNTTGHSNTANGYGALFSNTTGHSNTANGTQALSANTTGESNTANGRQALLSNTSGNSNVATGVYALYSNTTGSSNSAHGTDALYYNTTGYFNTANGYQALSLNTTGHSNSVNGYYALHNNTTGFYNTALGFKAGENVGVALQTMSNSVFIGADANSSVDGVTNSMALGNGAQVTASNQVVLGNTSVTQTLLNGNVILGAPARLKSYTVATLPAGTQGDVAYVTDAEAPTYLSTIASGAGADVVTPVFYNGTNWVAH